MALDKSVYYYYYYAHQHKAAGRKTRLDIQNYGCNGHASQIYYIDRHLSFRRSGTNRPPDGPSAECDTSHRGSGYPRMILCCAPGGDENRDFIGGKRRGRRSMPARAKSGYKSASIVARRQSAYSPVTGHLPPPNPTLRENYCPIG